MLGILPAALDIKKLILAGILTKTTLFGRAGGAGDFGGGDIVRAEFLNRGEAIVMFLEETSAGQSILEKNKLNLENLKLSLDVNKLTITEEIIIDRTGSVVDAVGAPGLIVLNRNRWLEHSERESDVYFLIFHEMLRENGINDDNYVISKALIPFPEKYKLQNILVTEKPLLPSDRLDDLINRNTIAFNGTGCPSNSLKTFTRFNPSLNEFEIYPNEMAAAVNANTQQLVRKSCAVRIPFLAKAGKKIQITQVDLAGEVELQKNKLVSVNYTTGFTSGSGKSNSSETKPINATDRVVDGGFLIRDNKIYESQCGQSAMLILNSDVNLRTSVKIPVAEKTSVARVNKMRLSLKLVDCVK
jgi:hypothetical protein